MNERNAVLKIGRDRPAEIGFNLWKRTKVNSRGVVREESLPLQSSIQMEEEIHAH